MLPRTRHSMVRCRHGCRTQGGLSRRENQRLATKTTERPERLFSFRTFQVESRMDRTSRIDSTTDPGRKRAMADADQDSSERSRAWQDRVRHLYGREGLLSEHARTLRDWKPLSPEECDRKATCGTLPARSLRRWSVRSQQRQRCSNSDHARSRTFRGRWPKLDPGSVRRVGSSRMRRV